MTFSQQSAALCSQVFSKLSPITAGITRKSQVICNRSRSRGLSRNVGQSLTRGDRVGWLILEQKAFKEARAFPCTRDPPAPPRTSGGWENNHVPQSVRKTDNGVNVY